MQYRRFMGTALSLAVSSAAISVSAGIFALVADSTPTAAQQQSQQGSTAAPLQLQKGDHIAILGGTLPDRMQHDGYLEALIYARFPKDDLVIRNLAAAGDEVNTWQRSENFGTRDQWLTRAKADVIFAFYGFNESFKGDAGLAQFKTDLDKFLKETATKNYNGKGAPRVVLFSPIAAEAKRDPNSPDVSTINANLKKYTAAMKEVAKANNVRFVDLLDASQGLYDKAAAGGQSLTINGIHLTPEGDKLLAPEQFRGTFDETPPAIDTEKLRAAIIERNEEWHSRYRTVDGYNVYGGRSAMAYQPGKGGSISNRQPPAPYVSNYEVMQQEMSQRDVMTANRDARVWAVAQGSDLQVQDNDLPPVRKVETNHPGDKPDGSWTYLSGEAAISKMKVPPHCKINLFASEEQFPELVKPVQMAWDTKGRLWVAAWHNYPERTPTDKVGDSILIFEDTNGDGKADKVTHFIDGLNCPTGFTFYKDGILLMQAPDLLYVHTGADGKAGKVERVLMGMDSADSHHTTNSMVLEPGGATYLSDGVFHRTQVETAEGPVRNEDACIYRYEPNTGKFERYAPYSFANPHGRVFDYWGNDLVTDATGNNTYFGPAFSGHLDYPAKHAHLDEFWKRPSRPCPGTAIITSKHFPEEFWGNFLNCNVISFQGIYRVKTSLEGSGLKGETLPEEMISSTDPNFRPVQAAVGPDGGIYVADWSNDIIGHLQHHLRDPNRDHVHGRIYRITYEGRPLEKMPQIDGAPVAALLELLKDSQDQIRTLAKIELGKHDSKEVIAATNAWAQGLDKKDPAYAHNLTEALWVHQWHNVVDEALLKQVLTSPEPNARAAATRVLCYWRDRVADALPLLKTAADDESPRVRLEAVRAASFFKNAEAVDVALTSLKHSSDYYLDYVMHETMKQLEPVWRQAVAQGKAIGAGNPAGLDFLIGSMSTAELLKLPQSGGVLEAVLTRSDVPDATRLSSLVTLAQERKTTTPQVLLDLIEPSAKSTGGAGRAAALAKLLPMQPTADLAKVRDRIAAIAEHGSTPDLRQPAWAALVAADGSFDKVWPLATKSPTVMTDVLSAVPLLFDQDIRNSVQDKVRALLAPQLPDNLVAGINSKPGVKGRYVRLALPKKGTLSLAEVQVFSGGQNVAIGGKAKQSSTSNGGDAGRAIDGRTDGAFGAGTMTHTKEGDKDPWWEVDLGREFPIDSVVVWNRSEGNGQYADRLNGFSLEIRDAAHHETFGKTGNPAPAESVKFAIGSDGVGDLRRAAIRAAVSMPKDQAGTFVLLAGLIEKNEQTAAAARGIKSLPRNSWKPDAAGAAAKAMVAWAKTMPATERTSEEYVQTVQLANELAGTLPAAQASSLRNELKALRVDVFIVGTVREQMRYDTPRLVVQAGKPFAIIVENGDMMPHNLVVVRPGTRAKVGTASSTMRPDESDVKGRQYVPSGEMDNILAATKLLDPGQKMMLNVNAPSQEGDYEYVCTFPGHWETMWGTLVVTKDVDAYLQAHPTAGPAAGAATGAHVHHAQ